jgi:hypothetical protein
MWSAANRPTRAAHRTGAGTAKWRFIRARSAHDLVVESLEGAGHAGSGEPAQDELPTARAEAPAERVVPEQLPNRDGQCSGVLGGDASLWAIGEAPPPRAKSALRRPRGPTARDVRRLSNRWLCSPAAAEASRRPQCGVVGRTATAAIAYGQDQGSSGTGGRCRAEASGGDLRAPRGCERRGRSAGARPPSPKRTDVRRPHARRSVALSTHRHLDLGIQTCEEVRESEVCPRAAPCPCTRRAGAAAVNGPTFCSTAAPSRPLRRASTSSASCPVSRASRSMTAGHTTANERSLGRALRWEELCAAGHPERHLHERLVGRLPVKARYARAAGNGADYCGRSEERRTMDRRSARVALRRARGRELVAHARFAGPAAALRSHLEASPVRSCWASCPRSVAMIVH